MQAARAINDLLQLPGQDEQSLMEVIDSLWERTEIETVILAQMKIMLEVEV